ncbi:hypothetical protein LTS14_008001 [Recurvomyces mirabilis]|nr:hypothetical protein LTS14_008001 [Recurvomyces mirabilis]
MTQSSPASHETLHLHSGISSIRIDGQVHEEAEKFEILPTGRCIVYDDYKRKLLEHVFSEPEPKRRFPWTNNTDGLRSIAWTTDENIEWADGRKLLDRPVFSFRDSNSYRIYQTEVRQRKFVDQFGTREIVPKKDSNFQRSSDSYVKIWDDHTSRYISLPLGSGHEIVHREVACSLVGFTKWTDTSVELRFGGGHRKSSPASALSRAPTFENFKRGLKENLNKVRPPPRSGTLPSVPARRDSGSIPLSSHEHTGSMNEDEISAARLATEVIYLTISFSDSSSKHFIPLSSLSLLTALACVKFKTKVEEKPELHDPTERRHETLDTAPPHKARSAHSDFASSASTVSEPVSIRGSSTNPSSLVSSDEVGAGRFGTSPKSKFQDTAPSWDTSPLSAAKTISGSSGAHARNTSGNSAESYFHPAEPRPVFHHVPRRPLPVHGASSADQSNQYIDGDTAPERIIKRPSLPQNTSNTVVVTPAARCSTATDARALQKVLLTPGELQEQRDEFWNRHPTVVNTARARAIANQNFYLSELTSSDEIRLVNLSPGIDGMISITFHARTLSSVRNTYEALSYCWGSDENSEYIKVNSRFGYRVSRHLARALRRLRFEEKPRWLWIDAICINQASLHEMNHQVPLMGNIYAHARRTLIWISELEQTEAEASCLRSDVADGDDVHNATLCCRGAGSAREHFGDENKLRDALRRFSQELELTGSGSVWWKRLWCVQESRFHYSELAPSVYVAQHAISWDHFARVTSNIEGIREPLELFKQLRTGDDRSLHDLLANTGAFGCSDPRDRIFALLNMCGITAHMLKPDYGNSILEVLEDATMLLINNTGTIDVLLDRRLDRTHGTGYGPGVLPTWIPDFQRLQSRDLTRGKDEYCAGSVAGFGPDVRLRPALNDENATQTLPRILEMKATLFGKISRVTSLADETYESCPSGKLIYNGFMQPGTLVKKILEDLAFDFSREMRVDNLDRAPRIGRLMLEFLFEEQRNHLDEHDYMSGDVDGAAPAYNTTNLWKAYAGQEKDDVNYVKDEGLYNDQDELYVQEYWSHRREFLAREDNILEVRRMVDSNKAPWDAAFMDESICRDFKVAFDVENLFSFARTQHRMYYFASQHYHRPMRSNVLARNNVLEVLKLETHNMRREGDLEMHHYSAKSRCQEFFKTAGGFVGLGPSIMRPDDILVIPLGASRPMVLRQLGQTYIIIGEAILPGLMHGPWVKAHGHEAQYYPLS